MTPREEERLFRGEVKVYFRSCCNVLISQWVSFWRGIDRSVDNLSVDKLDYVNSLASSTFVGGKKGQKRVMDGSALSLFGFRSINQ